MKKIFIVAAMIIAATNVFAQKQNLRANNGCTSIGVSVGCSEEGVASNFSVNRYHAKWHYGFEFSEDFVKNTSEVNLSIGPKFGKKFFVAPAITFGLGQRRVESVYTNPETGDLLEYTLPNPQFLLGGKLRLGYNFKNFGIFAGVNYNYALSYNMTQEMEEPWVLKEQSDYKHKLTAEIGIAYIFNNKATISGDNCLVAACGGGYSSMGSFMSLDITGYNALEYNLVHYYGATCAFYTENGNAEIGGKYMIGWYPKGIKSSYNAAVGVSAVMGQYQRTWKGEAKDDPSRVHVNGQKHSLGGGLSLEVVPVALQLGRVNLSLFGSIGCRLLTAVKGEGDLNYNAQSTSKNLSLFWRGGLAFEWAF